MRHGIYGFVDFGGVGGLKVGCINNTFNLNAKSVICQQDIACTCDLKKVNNKFRNLTKD